MKPLLLSTLVFLLLSGCFAAEPPPGFTALWNEEDLAGWWGVGTENPRAYMALPADEFRKKQDASLADIRQHWRVKNGELVGDGQGLSLATDRNFGDFELLADYKAAPLADGGISLRGCPKVKAANPPGEWNHLRVLMAGSRVWVWLNGQPMVSGETLGNAFDSALPVPVRGPIQLQAQGGEIRWRNIFIRELGSDEANKLVRGADGGEFKSAFNGRDFSGWTGAVDDYEVLDGAMVCKTGRCGTVYTVEEFANFVVRLEFKLPPGGNNGLAIRYPGEGIPGYTAMCESQVLDDAYPDYAGQDPRQFHGSAYGMVAAHRGYLRPTGNWNYQEVTVTGLRIKVELNGTVILDTDLSKVTEFLDNKEYPGRNRTTGHFGFAGHLDRVMFRNVSIKPLP